MKKLPHPTDIRAHAYMKLRQAQNRSNTKTNSNEQEVLSFLKANTEYKWTPQATWGYRLYDFFSSELGVAIEVDGKEHVATKDYLEDEYNFRRSAIVVLRVRNGNRADMEEALKVIQHLGTWKDRRILMCMEPENASPKRLKDARSRIARLAPNELRMKEEFITCTSTGSPLAFDSESFQFTNSKPLDI